MDHTPSSTNDNSVLDYVLKHSSATCDYHFLSDLEELLRRERFLNPENCCASFFDPVCRDLPKEIPLAAKRKIQEIAISQLFATTVSRDARTVSLAILRYMGTAASANACLLALQMTKSSDRHMIHQSASALNVIRGSHAELFLATRLDDLQKEVERLDLKWNLEFNSIDTDQIQ